LIDSPLDQFVVTDYVSIIRELIIVLDMTRKTSRFASLLLCMAAIFALLISGCGGQDESAQKAASTMPVKMATTTSTANTGLLDYLMDAFKEDTGIRVDFVATGTGKAIKHGENGDVDVILVHAPPSEEAFVRAGHGLKRIPVMWNDFVVLGPPSDPAGLSTCGSAEEAFEKISATKTPFVSRGDDSGTHKKEMILWKNAGIVPGCDWYIEAGQGMGASLTMAHEKLACILTDRGTYLAMKDKLELIIAYEGDSNLVNPYAIIAVNPERYPDTNSKGVAVLIDWIVSPRAKKLITDFKVNGEQLFFLFD
jgi:tungstate transport system substrate-binding protein